MALIHSKQINPKFTGSFTISGSNALSTIGGITSDTLTLTHITASGNISSSGNLFVTQNVDVDGTSNFAGNMTLQNNLTTLGNVSSSGNLFVTQNVDVDGTSNFAGDVVLQNDLSLSGHITASGNISASGTVFASKFQSAGASNETILFNDNLNITGSITNTGDIITLGSITSNKANGLISGSGTSTGSFGKIKLANETHLGVGQNGKFAISGSSVSTASFGLVKIHEIQGNSTISFGDNILMKRDLEFLGNISGSGNIRTSGNVIASRFESSGSNSMQFGVTSTDKHEFTGSVAVTGSLNVEKGRIFEQGTSVIDHATAMAIVFGG